jgi:putative ABC transport system permease protein
MQDDSGFFLLEGSWPNKEREIVVTKAFNTITEKSIGDTMTIYGSEFLISGIASSEKWTAAVIFMPVTQAENLYQTQGVFQLGFIQLNNTVDANLVQQFLETNLNEGDCCSVYQDDHFVALYRDAVKGIRFLARILQLIVLFLIAFGSYNASALVLNEHEREIALLHVVGFSTKVINGILMIRLWILLFISYFIGYVCALIYSKWYLSNLRLAISGNLIRLEITWNSFLLGAGLIFLFAVIGVWFSLRHQYTKNINTSLQKVFSGRVG